MSIQRNLFYQYDIPGTLTFGRFLDTQNVRGFIQTSGSSTTTTATESSGEGAAPFAQAQEGDWLQVGNRLTNYQLRRITAVGSASSVTVNSAWNLTSQAAKILPFRSGTGADDGWVYVGSLKNVTIRYALTTLGATNVRFLIQVKGGALESNPFDLFDVTLSATGSDSFSIVEPWTWLRVGVDETSGSGTDVIDVILLADDTVSLS